MIKITRRIVLLSFLLPALISCTDSPEQDKNKENPYAAEVDSVLGLMTLEEKIGQTVLFTSGWDVTGPSMDDNYKEYLENGSVGAVFNAFTTKYNRELQKIAVEHTRLGIPLLFGYDVIHGHRTIFPIPLGESASWDLELMEKTARIAAVEASAEGINWTFAPMVDIARDARWGRIAEGAGEDTYLGSLIARARVKGFQGDDLSADNTILACAKHYAAYGAALSGRDYNTVDMSENELRTTYLPPFKAALDAGVATFMNSFNDLNGVPATGNNFLLRNILKGDWKFNGFVVTDYTSMNEMVAHGYARDDKHAGEIAMNAGVDMDMQGGIYMKYLKKSIEEGKVSETDLDDAVRRILEMKFRLGLFDDPYRYMDETREKEEVLNKEHLAVARDAARKSMVLLKNDNEVLPLSSDSKVALIGPLVKDEKNIIGNWAAAGDRGGTAVSVFEAFEERLGTDNFLYAEGCKVLGEDISGFKEAVSAAGKADVVVMVVGELEGMTGEAASRTDINIPGRQKQLIEAIKETGKPVVLVLMNGRPLTLEWENETADAILEAWWPGTMGGHAIADVLYGDYNPSGKLTVSFPRAVGQLPLFYNHKNTGRPIKPEDPDQKYVSRYLYTPNTPLYPFGYGLSYTTFAYDVVTDKKSLTPGDTLTITAKVTNTGERDGEETVQLYVHDKVASITPPVKELKRFRKIFLRKGESKNVTFSLSAEDLKFYNQDLEWVYEPGAFEFFVGGSSDLPFTHTFELAEK
ncbi:beta-glucosidase BglX [Sinomicrobium pectinilyticum]|uniref:Periplasmic beta-glucosidase n=1 Tax=Sinomicrobium pectinilyticum TaxID=1084421 RepID=A0A3N0F5E4_SINP1|nr:beta-glucosidase BglX [Sinomicrobium pectinilyticum]RNL95281.1 beta-glucosidase BglX [Sinomicrobium pectinilyticum]